MNRWLLLLLLLAPAPAWAQVPCELRAPTANPQKLFSNRGKEDMENALPVWRRRAAGLGRRLALLPSTPDGLLPPPYNRPGVRYAVSTPLPGAAGVLSYDLVLERWLVDYRVHVTNLQWTPQKPDSSCPPVVHVEQEIRQVLHLLKAALNP